MEGENLASTEIPVKEALKDTENIAEPVNVRPYFCFLQGVSVLVIFYLQ